MTEKKFVKRDFFNVVLENAEAMALPEGMTAKDVVAFAENELGLLARKNAKSKGKTENVELSALKNAVVVEMEKNRLYTVTELMKSLPTFISYEENRGKTLTNQRVTSVVHSLLDEGKVERITEKGRAYFKVVG